VLFVYIWSDCLQPPIKMSLKAWKLMLYNQRKREFVEISFTVCLVDLHVTQCTAVLTY